MKTPERKGFFVSLEGPEGSGKSTLLARLASALAARGLPVLATREPGGEPGAERIRELVLRDGFVPRAEALLFLAARAQHVEAVIRPALASGAIVLCDRFHDSTLAYQGYGLRLELEPLRQACRFASGDLMPDLTLLLDLPVSVGLARRGTLQPTLALELAPPEEATTRPTAIDLRPVSFHERVREGFLAEARRDPRRIKVIDASRGPEEVFRDAWKQVMAVLPRGRAHPRTRGAS